MRAAAGSPQAVVVAASTGTGTVVAAGSAVPERTDTAVKATAVAVELPGAPAHSAAEWVLAVRSGMEAESARRSALMPVQFALEGRFVRQRSQ